MRTAKLFVLSLLFVAGCAWFSQDKPDPLDQIEDETKIVKVIKWKTRIETVQKNIGWMQAVLMVGAVGAIAACFLGQAKFGIPAVGTCLIGYGLVSANLWYPQLVALVGFVVGVGLLGFAIYVNRRAFVEIVTGGELIQGEFGKQWGAMTERFKGCHSAAQSKTTEKMVEKARKKINGN